VSNVICHGRIPLDNLWPLIKDCQFPAEARVLMEQLPQHIVTRQAERQALLLFEFFDLEIKFEQYTSGRIFQDAGELRWEKERDQFRIVYAGDEGELSKNVEKLLCKYHENNEPPSKLFLPTREPHKKYYLFGTRLENDTLEKIGAVAKKGDFAEVRIQRLLRYPLDPLKKESTKGPICLIVQEMYDQATGQLALFRFVGLDENDEKGDEEATEE
jgi:hypothetical protein